MPPGADNPLAKQDGVPVPVGIMAKDRDNQKR